MLFRADVLDGIGSGAVTVAFRRWKRPTVTEGGTLRTPVGVLHIDELRVIDAGKITGTEARAAGFASRDEAIASVAPRADDADRRLYRVRFHLAGDDPRIALRSDSTLDAAERQRIDARLDRWDRAADSPWTRELLALIAARPGCRSADLASHLGLEQPRLKRRVRQLKELGLTESLEIGYRLSARGAALLGRPGSSD